MPLELTILTILWPHTRFKVNKLPHPISSPSVLKYLQVLGINEGTQTSVKERKLDIIFYLIQIHFYFNISMKKKGNYLEL